MTARLLGADPSDGLRFEFGANWARFLATLTPERIAVATQSLQKYLEADHLQGRRFIDIGSGSGLFSLAARRLGARVHSFDYDPLSVRCTRELRNRFFAGDADWTVEQGSVLDRPYLASLGRFDVVYSWGVLHHTGDMWTALENVAPMVEPGGKLFIALYNDQGPQSRRWHLIKRTYNNLPRPLRLPYGAAVMGVRELRLLAGATVRGKIAGYVTERTHYASSSARGMSYWHDMIDWVGGYPFEVARPEQVFAFYRARGFVLTQLRTINGFGCNQFVLQRSL